MKKYINVSFALFSLAIIGCDELVEADIAEDLITIIAPKNDAIVEGNTVQFRWNAIDGASDYRIQLTRERDQFLILDSLVSATVFELTLDSSAYQWRVRGENFGYHSPYTFPVMFSTRPSVDLTNQRLDLLKPDENIVTNAPLAILYSWTGIETATHYIFELLNVSNGVESSKTKLEDLEDTEVQLDSSIIFEDGDYKWRVQAINENNSTNTEFFSKSFAVDTEAPPASTLTSPSTGTTLPSNEEITFSWTFTDVGVVQSEITWTLQIATDANFSEVISEDDTLTTTSYTYTPTLTGNLYWRVKGKDSAGNEGSYEQTGGELTIN